MEEQKEIKAWHSWREACAFGLLGEEERRWLRKIVGDRFRSRVKRLNAYGAELPMPQDAVCAHLFESWCALHPRRDGKRYKDWLLTRGRRDLDTLQSGVMLLVRNVVREWVRDAQPDACEVSLDEPITEASGFTLLQLLPERNNGREKDKEDWCRLHAMRVAEEADAVDSVALAVRREGKVFSHPQVKEETGFGKTTLHQRHRNLMETLAAQVKEDFPGMDAPAATGIVLDVLDQAGEIILSKKNAEK
jgi:hypothetical protein